jgi:hypothetical protein
MMPKELKTEAIKRILGPHLWAEMCRRFDGNTPERVAWIGGRLWDGRLRLMDWNNLLKEAEAELAIREAKATTIEAEAKAAAAELKLVDTLADVQHWWKRHYLKAGHKRLGRVLLEFKKDPS